MTSRVPLADSFEGFDGLGVAERLQQLAQKIVGPTVVSLQIARSIAIAALSDNLGSPFFIRHT